ncbi:MAG: hypothetical protein ABI885_25760 [Gammaproteobacteria bacterium]
MQLPAAEKRERTVGIDAAGNHVDIVHGGDSALARAFAVTDAAPFHVKISTPTEDERPHA